MKEIIIDLENYNSNGTVFRRTAVRGIVKRGDKYLIIHSKYGDYKFPGGGQKKDEDNMATLIREVKEETGYTVIMDSVKEAFVTYEKRKGDPDDLMEMTSYYYFCDVEETQGERNLDDYEAEYDYKVKWMKLEDIIAENDKVTDYENIPWVIREQRVMKELFIPQV
jgi:8-oxo-dGTP pyrophosphatase MutT (NUDIX family)